MVGASEYVGYARASRAVVGSLAALLCGWFLHAGIAPAMADGAADALEQDAQAYTRLAVRHDSLLLKLNMKRITPQEEKEMDAVRAEGAAIKAKYAPGGPMSRQAAAFEKRLKELSAQVVQPAIKAAVVDAFPSVGEVRAVYQDPPHAIAALQILEHTMTDKVGQPPLPALTAKVAGYHASMAQLNPKADSDYTSVLDATDTLRRSREFQFEVLDRFVPVYAGETGSALNEERYEARAGAEEQQIDRAYVVVGLIVLAVPLLSLMRGQRVGRRAKPWSKDEAYPFQLPLQLRRVGGFCATYLLEFDCGLVTDKRVVKQTTEYTTQTVTRSGAFTAYGPETSSTSTTITHKYVLRTPDDRTIRREYLSENADAEVGHVVSSLEAGDWVLAWHNHSLNTNLAIADNIDHINRMPARRLWVASIVVAFAGLWAVQRFLVETGTHADDWRFSYMVGSLTLLAAIVSAIWIAIIKSVVDKVRVRRFYERVLPPLAQFMAERTPFVQRHYGQTARSQEGFSTET
jgi:hypothetical protein